MTEMAQNGSVLYGSSEFWEQVRVIVREEIQKVVSYASPLAFTVPGLTYKPLYKMKEICLLFDVSRQTIYEWIKLGKCRPVKIRSRVYFLWREVEGLINDERNDFPKPGRRPRQQQNFTGKKLAMAT